MSWEHMKKLIIAVLVLTVLGVTVTAYVKMRGRTGEPQLTTATVSRGDIRQTVEATGTMQAVSTVEVGSQVSGRISEIHADFNSVVHNGQVIARIDPLLFQAQVDQARATLTRVQAQGNRAKVQQQDAAAKLARAKELAAANLISRQDFDTAQTTYDAVADVRSAEADAVQAHASLNQAEVNLQHTIIQAPSDGVVIARNVEVGQTVAATMQAPTLFIIAGDLSKMQVNASIDEADIGSIRPRQPVRFKVDAYPDREFTGTVTQVRMQPTTVQNVTTYTTVIDVPNGDLLLKPGMTANVTVEVARRDDVMRLPTAAVRFRPTPEVLAALGQSSPTGRNRGGSNAGASSRPSQASNGTPRPGTTGVKPEAPAEDWRKAKTIDAAFGPLETPTTDARVWQYRDGQLAPVKVKVGLSDGSSTELISGPLTPGAVVVTGAALASATTASSTSGQARSPLLPQFPRRSSGGGSGGRR
jgi:HlyD family secretion protein